MGVCVCVCEFKFGVFALEWWLSGWLAGSVWVLAARLVVGWLAGWIDGWLSDLELLQRKVVNLYFIIEIMCQNYVQTCRIVQLRNLEIA